LSGKKTCPPDAADIGLNMLIACILDNFEQSSISSDFVVDFSKFRTNVRALTSGYEHLQAKFKGLAIILKVRIAYKTVTSVPTLKRARRRLRRFVSLPAFQNFMTVVVLVSFAALAFETPTTHRDVGVIEIIDITTNSVFLVEFLCKAFAFGTVAYFTNGWNILDFVVLVVCVTLPLFVTSAALVHRSIRILTQC
jgi:hypothetical protein